MENYMTSETRSLVYCALFTALIAVGAFIKIPILVVPFTLQYLFTMLAGILLGSRLGSLFLYCFVLAVPGDICLSILGAVIGRRVRPFLK